MGFNSFGEWYVLNIDNVSRIFLDVEITAGDTYHRVLVTLFLC